MVKEVIWTPRAQADRKAIFQFWIEHNQSDTYSRKLNQLFKDAVSLITSHPHVGKSTDIENVQFKIVRNYMMFYELSESRIYILTIWDSRQNPEHLKIK